MAAGSGRDIDQLREEVRKLSQVVTEVMGEEYDSILSQQTENQQSTLRWIVMSIALSISTMQLLVEHGLISGDELRERVRAVHRRLGERAEAMGASPVLDVFLDPEA